MSRMWVFPVVIAAMLAGIVALVGATITDTGPWYQALAKPDWAPPDVAYGVAWTAIYACTALAGVTGWLAAPTWRAREWLLGLFALNGFLNILWSLLFFRLHRPDWAVVEVVALWLSVALLMVVGGRHSRVSAALLLPYLLWVGFAGYLNWTIVQLNAPF
ncbi:tryptophan-rich sensory protein [Sphingomonas ginsenosidivorax]|uniref:Tryptophan-rich sensory protein n=1 Tax=Sphingomonas ginsenosidivorax TaxID=862135 RepID=A0A5C6UEC4_9SPHN|nr:TspO/MBR family protein [Sphingomonas ginsenosidivorax]TXC71157.1 tryptophan-rich sensory protein [Sphingomonas ginsenosidivorax]